MFGRGEKYVLPVMDLYPKDVIREVDEALNGKRPSYITRIPFEALMTLSIDKVTLRKNPANGEVSIILYHEVGGEYMKSWHKGLGRFVIKDFKKGQNGKQYVFVRYTSDDKKKKVALVRFISKEEAVEIEDMKAYGAITGELASWVDVTDPYNPDGSPVKAKGDLPGYSIEEENYYVVLRVVPYVPSMKPEDVLSIMYPIKREDTKWFSIEPNLFEDETTKASRQGHKVDEEPDTEGMNPPEDTLF